MRSRSMLAMATAFLLGFGNGPAQAGGLAGSGAADPFVMLFDEQGHCLLGPWPGTPTVPQDPIGPGQGLLGFLCPSPVITGDVRIWEDFVGGTLSDVLRFTNANGDLDGALNGDRMIVYSELPEPGSPPDRADVGIPTQLFPNDGGGVVEVGTEGNNGATWAPGGPLDSHYFFVSDGTIPEPSSIIMLSLGVLGAAGYGWHRRRAGVA